MKTVTKPKTQKEVVEAIDRIANFRGAWSIGGTADPVASREAQGSPRFWYHWPVEADDAVKQIIDYFVDKGMNPVQGSSEDPGHVYIFLPYRPTYRRPGGRDAS